jgi:hypothetical protein
MDNIIQFPKKADQGFPNNLNESFDHIEDVRRNYCDEVSADIIEAAFSVLSSYGLQVTPDESSVKNIVFFEEAVKALVYTTKKLHHPFQDLAEQAVTLEADAKKELDRILEENQLIT